MCVSDRCRHLFPRAALTLAWLLALLLGLLVTGASTGSAASPSDVHWVWPLAPRPIVLSGFDPPDQPWLPGHRGVDLAGTPSQRVRSAGAGEVSYAGDLAGIGVVVVSHGDLRTTYQPVRATVEVGTSVSAGEQIGRLKATGSHCAPEACLHWGLLRGQAYLDPLSLVGAGPVRLLPLGDDARIGSYPVTAGPRGAAPHEPAGPANDDQRWAWPAVVGGLAAVGSGWVLYQRTGGRPTPAGAPADRPPAGARW